MTPIQYIPVVAGTEAFDALQYFARTFNHEVHPSPDTQHFLHFRDGNPIGYSDLSFQPVVYPAFHPGHCSPRDVMRVVENWKSHFQISRQPALIGVPLNNDDGEGNFPEETMRRLGLVRLRRELYAATF